MAEVAEYWVAESIKERVILDVSIKEFLRATGDAALKVNDHALGLVCTGVTVTTRIEGGTPRDYYWPPYSFGFLPAGMFQETHLDQPADLTFIRIAPRFFEHAAFEPIRRGQSGYRFLHSLTDQIGVHLCSALRALADDGKEHEWPLLLDTIVTSVAVRTMQLLGIQRVRPSVPYPSGLPPSRLRRVMEYIEANIDRPMRLTEIAGVAALSPHHFARAFRASMGIPPVRYVWQRRVERAKTLLRNPETPLAMIAIDCGFSSQSHFTTVFKREVGMTPTTYRAKL